MSPVRSCISNGVLHVVFNRPERKNALTTEMYASLCRMLELAELNERVKVLMFSGAEGVFTAGNDLDDFIQSPPSEPDAPVFRFMTLLAGCAKPLVAAVEGVAIGIGTTMLLHCDLVYVADDARFALPFVKLGLVPESGSSLLLPRVAGHQWAAEKFWFGDMFTAQEAAQLGFVNQVLRAEDVLYYAAQQAERLARLPAGSVQGTKALMKKVHPRHDRGLDPDEVSQRIRDEAELFARRLAGPATREALAAFKEKRRPNFAGLD